ncbi:MAG: hypothetical protein A3B68_02955 [Candidatus Melainabacteria bacterium RIFCSPHIGHO2_02_FULL_34_12]|nr:MAG: hypothetical protein A3B68_02955 [Candidatus Melainabacteria bacterium RIFCSPHIGHO2_02_FULL_34_12]
MTFNKKIGAKVITRKKGYCKVKLDMKPNHLNHGGIVHGGVLATLCDIALAGAIEMAMAKEEWCVTAQLNIQFLYPAFPNEPIFGFGQLIKKGNTLAFVEGGVKSKSNKLLVKAQGIWVIKSKKNKRIKKAKSLG